MVWYVVVCLLIAGVIPHPVNKKQPHILYIVMDDMGWADIGTCQEEFDKWTNKILFPELTVNDGHLFLYLLSLVRL